jgi:hypothetical protein
LKISDSPSAERVDELLERFPVGRAGEPSVAIRAAGLWFAVRVFAAMFINPMGGSRVLISVPMSVLVIALAAILAVIDARKHHEHLFIANLGRSNVAFALFCVLPPLLGEIALALVMR